MLLPDLQINNYRLFDSFEIKRLCQVNLIAGWNNTGKSSLLEAAYLVATDDALTALQQVLDTRGEKGIQALFHGYDLARGISIKSGGEHIKLYIPGPAEAEQTLAQRNLHLHNGAFLAQVQSAKDKTRNLIISDEKNVQFLRALSQTWSGRVKRAFLLPGTDSLSSRYDEMNEQWDRISLTPQADAVIEALKIIDSRVKNIDFLGASSNVKVLLEGENKPVLIGSLGDGMRHLLMMAILLASARGGVLLIDEIETGLHYTTMIKLWKLIFKTAKQLDVQVMATTHSWDCITAFSRVWQANESDGTYFRLSQKDEHIHPIFYTADELNVAVKQEIEVR